MFFLRKTFYVPDVFLHCYSFFYIKAGVHFSAGLLSFYDVQMEDGRKKFLETKDFFKIVQKRCET